MKKYKYDMSIIVPVYNNEKYIDACLKSILNQNFNIDRIQIILINDGSTDNSLKILKKYENENTIVIDKKNSGVSDTRNVGLKKAIGKYILFLDSDDYISKNTCKNLFNLFEKNYDEIDLITYPIIYDKQGKYFKHMRYKNMYKKGTGVYDLNKNYSLIQATVNVCIKNYFENNTLFYTKQNFSEDERFDTEILMKKKKIGFCKQATYYYRRHGTSANATITNPYYSFEMITSYYEYLFDKYQENGIVPKYIQALYVNNLSWRIKQDDLYPYHYEKKEYEHAIKRIVNLLKNVDNETIMNLENANIYLKLYILNLKGEKVAIKSIDNKYAIFDKNDTMLFEDDNFEIGILKFKVKNNQLYIFGDVRSPILNYKELKKLTLVTEDNKGNIKKSELKTFKSNLSRFQTNIEIANIYGFECNINLNNVKKFYFDVIIDGFHLRTKMVFGKWSGYSKAYHRYTVFKENKTISYHEHKIGYFKVGNKGILKRIGKFLVTFPYYVKKNINIIIYRMLGSKKQDIWLYYDSKGVIDNAYLQFKHDIKKNDGIKRYYVTLDDDKFLKEHFSDEEMQNILKFKSFKHKINYLRCKKIFVSYLTETLYVPFKSIIWYTDIIDYDLIYLQHGILHADLLRMYAKEFVPIDKFIISSTFERENLINKYHYNKNDLINSGMPRAGVSEEDVEVKNKILFAPSWRKYLIGPLINNTRVLRENDFLNSSFYKEINNFIKSKELHKLLKEQNLILDFKLHPIFREYKDYFDTNDVVKISFGDTKLGEYKMFITDFSSYQFDYIKYKRPMIYFLPDMVEFKAGLHTYKALDLPYDRAFGDLCLTSDELYNKISYYIKSDYKMENKYIKRIDNFFDMDTNPCEKIYRNVYKN